ncbi:MAG: hypothetical protein V1681_11815 [Candidatus Neomarinimicrobiota bacterium]
MIGELDKSYTEMKMTHFAKAEIMVSAQDLTILYKRKPVISNFAENGKKRIFVAI